MRMPGFSFFLAVCHTSRRQPHSSQSSFSGKPASRVSRTPEKHGRNARTADRFVIHSKVLFPESSCPRRRVCFLCRLFSCHLNMVEERTAWQPSCVFIRHRLSFIRHTLTAKLCFIKQMCLMDSTYLAFPSTQSHVCFEQL